MSKVQHSWAALVRSVLEDGHGGNGHAYLWAMNTREEHLKAFGRLLDIMDDLREKCPWDRKQTFESLRHLTIEETY